MFQRQKFRVHMTLQCPPAIHGMSANDIHVIRGNPTNIDARHGGIVHCDLIKNGLFGKKWTTFARFHRLPSITIVRQFPTRNLFRLALNFLDYQIHTTRHQDRETPNGKLISSESPLIV